MKPKGIILSVYLVALVQLLTAWLGFSISQEYLIEPPGRVARGGWEVFAAQHVAFERNNPEALADTMDWLRVELGLHATLFDLDGSVVASSHDPVPRPLSRSRALALPIREVIPGDEPDTYVVGIRDGAKPVAYVITDRFRFRRPLTRQILFGIALISVVLLGSLTFARSLIRPLRKLAEAARAFGRGELNTRTQIRRRDEMGEVAQAFDDMADRITTLLQSQQELLANVSHELRTPLARIRVALDLAAEGDEAATRDALVHITTDWGDLERLVEDVLATARLDLGASGAAAPLRRSPVDLGSMATSAAERFSIVYPQERLELEIEANLPMPQGDPDLLRRVVNNLVDNAQKYSDPGSPVRLRMRAESDGVSVTVLDQGMGIEEADLPHIFTPFFRADRSRNRKTGGVGMGLALVRRIVQAHGGRIEVESKVSEGTTISVHLPLDPSHPLAELPQKTPSV